MNDTTDYIDYLSSGNGSCFMGQSPPRITLSKATHTTPNALSSHSYMIPYIYNITPYMIYMMYVLLLLSIQAWGSTDMDGWGDGGDWISGWRAYTKCA